jgi:transcriptional regulator with XRE-family HTH domain
MILADKIIDLRKKSGWSQEELADKMGVSRQSISKWEGAQSVPDMNKILKLSEVFGVTTDYLLKDELGTLDEPASVNEETEQNAIRVSMEDASSFLRLRNVSASRVSLGVMLCIISPVLLIILSGYQEAGMLALSELQVSGIGVAVLFTLVGIGVALFVLTAIQDSVWEFLEKEPIDTEYGVSGMVKEQREKFRPTYTKHLTLGIVLCVIAVIPIFICMSIFDSENGLTFTAAVGFMLVIIGIGVLLIIRSSMIWSGMERLLEEGDYSRAHKEEDKRNAPIAAIYWSLMLAIYLAYSFLTGRWDQSWVIWPVAGVLYGAIIGIMRLIQGRT